MAEVFLGIGGNLGNREANLRRAVELLRPSLAGLRASALYETPPWGDAGQPPFLNAVLRGAASLEPLDLLDELQRIEAALGRVRTARRWGPRPLDLDILLYGRAEIDHPRLRVPHPRIRERGFVLRPLADLAAGLTLPPDGMIVGELLVAVDTDGIRRVAGPEWADPHGADPPP